MAKEKLITRTVKVMNVTVFLANLETKQITEATVTIPYAKKESKIFESARVILEDSNTKVASIKNVETAEKKYGMPESQFITEATEL